MVKATPSDPPHQALLTEISLPAYAGMTDVQIIAAINVKTASGTTPLAVLGVLRFLIRSGIWASAFLLANDTATLKSDPNKIACTSFIQAFSNPAYDTIDFTDGTLGPGLNSLFSGVVTAGCMTSGQLTGLKNSQNVTVPWTTSVGLPLFISSGDLAIARS